MEAVPTVPCHQAASCPMLLWFFPRKLVKAISGESKTVISVHGRSWTFFLTGDVQCARVSKPLQASKSAGSRRRPDAAGAPPDAGGAGAGPSLSQPVAAGAEGGEQADAPNSDDEAQGSEVLPLQFADVAGEADFDKEGFGEAGAMIFTRPMFKDRELVRRLLLTGRSRFPVNSCVDNCNVTALVEEVGATRKKRVKPSKPQVM